MHLCYASQTNMVEKKLFKNYIYNVTYQLVLVLTPLLTVPYISRVLSADGIGKQSYTLAIVSIFTLFSSLGSGIYGQREIAYQQGDKAKESKVFWELFSIRLVTGGVGTLCYFLYIFFFADVSYRTLLLIQASNLLLVFFDTSWFFQGKENFKSISIRMALVKLCSLPYYYLFIKSETDLWKYALYVPLSTLIAYISYLPSLKKSLVKVSIKDIHPFNHLKRIILLFIPQIATQIYTVLDKVMIGAICKDAVQNGFYEQNYKIISVIIPLTTAMCAVATPRVALLYKQKDTKEIGNLFLQSMQFVLMLSLPIVAGLIILAPTFVPLFLGESFRDSAPLLQTLSFILLIIGCSGVSGTQTLLPTGQEKFFTISVSIGAVTNVLLNSILIPRQQALGAAIATVLAELTIAILQWVHIRALIPWKGIIIQCLKDGGAAFVMAVVLRTVLINLFNTATWLGLIEAIVVSAIIYGVCLLLFHDPLFYGFLRKAKNKR